jgi:carbamoyltransferase
MTEAILGISAFYHDSAAALLMGGRIVATAQEERFTRKKHDAGFPVHAIRYVLQEAGLTAGELDVVAYYEKPFIKFERLLETYHAFAPRGLESFLTAVPLWIKEKLFIRRLIKNELAEFGGNNLKLLFPEHHLSHAASAYYPSPFNESAILTLDGVGEWATTTISHGAGNKITILRELDFPHSIGLLYSAFTYYCGFKVNSGEYKLMGLAPYGNPASPQVRHFRQVILNELIDLREDGSLILNMNHFDYATGLKMCRDKAWEKLFGVPRREPETDILPSYMNMALAIQQVTEEVVLKLAATAKGLTGSDHLCMAGGVALNCVANGKLLQQKIFKNIWIQPAAGDAGGALGAALAVRYIWKGRERVVDHPDSMSGSCLGPEFDDKAILRMAGRYGAPYEHYHDFGELCRDVADFLSLGYVVGWFQGRMEYGPRALGNRSILGDARRAEMQKRLNLKIKHREGFRPFAPVVLAEDSQQYFDLEVPSPYMLLVAPVKKERRHSLPDGYEEIPMFERLYYPRSDIPAVTHIDFSARIQTVHKETNERLWRLVNAFKEQTGYGILINTSFNLRGEPIVCSPEDAYRCFMRTEMDYLIVGDFVFDKKRQPPWKDNDDWRAEYKPD